MQCSPLQPPKQPLPATNRTRTSVLPILLRQKRNPLRICSVSNSNIRIVLAPHVRSHRVTHSTLHHGRCRGRGVRLGLG